MAGQRGLILLLQMNVSLLIGLCNISGCPTFHSGVLRLYSHCAAHLFIYLFIVSCILHVAVTCTMLQKQVSVFSIFIITVYQSLKSNLCSLLHENLLAVTCLSYQYGPSMSNNVVRK